MEKLVKEFKILEAEKKNILERFKRLGETKLDVLTYGDIYYFKDLMNKRLKEIEKRTKEIKKEIVEINKLHNSNLVAGEVYYFVENDNKFEVLRINYDMESDICYIEFEWNDEQKISKEELQSFIKRIKNRKIINIK